jgi:hypothetical protein
MNYLSTKTIASKLFPGVIYTLKKMSHPRRLAFNLSVSDALARRDDIGREFGPLQEERERIQRETKISPCTCAHAEHEEDTGRCKTEGCDCRTPPTYEVDKRIAELEVKNSDIVLNEINPALVRWGLAKISGFQIDGREPNAELLLSDGPELLVHEIASEITSVMQLSPLEAENFESPSTSGAPADGQTSDSSAPIASAKSST